MTTPAPPPEPERLLSVAEVAARLGKTPRTVRNWIRHGVRRWGRRVKLDALPAGGWYAVAEADLDRFQAELSREALPLVLDRPSPAKRSRAQQRAVEELDRMGIRA